LTLRSVALIVVVAGLTSACAAKRFDRLMRTWEGRSLTQLLTTWGPPRTVYADGTGGHVVAYVPAAGSRTTEPRGVATSGPHLANDILHPPEAQPVYAPQVSATWPIYRLFFVNAQGRIYQSQWKGDWVCCGM
jgi:hypothetical protein